MTKRGWKDEASQRLGERKLESGFQDRADIETFFQYIDADEGRFGEREVILKRLRSTNLRQFLTSKA